jgi:type I restriction enzyme R subunit
LDVLRTGIKDSGCAFKLAYFRPATGLNEELQRLHSANLFTVVRQLQDAEEYTKTRFVKMAAVDGRAHRGAVLDLLKAT